MSADMHGTHPTTPLEPPLARWAGRCMALIEGTNLSFDTTAEERYRLYPIERLHTAASPADAIWSIGGRDGPVRLIEVG